MDEQQHKAAAHGVQFYREDRLLIDTAGRFLGTALGRGEAGIVIASREHRRKIAGRLQDSGLDVSCVRAAGRYVEVDAEEILAEVMAHGRPDAARCAAVMGEIIARANAAAESEHKRAAVFGEGVDLLCTRGDFEGAIRLERMWNELARTHAFSLLCAYAVNDFRRAAHAGAFREICEEHSSVLPTESYLDLRGEDDRLRYVTQLQQKAQALETEIAEHQAAEQALSENQRRMQAVFNQGYSFGAILRLDGTILDVNTTAAEGTGFRREQLVGRRFWETPWWSEWGEEQDSIRRALAEVGQGRTVRGDCRYRRGDGQERLADRSLAPVKNEAGEVVLIVVSGIDITERQRSEEALLRSERLAATGRLAASIAHEINNPLTSLTNLLYLLQAHASLDATARHYAKLADEELRRTACITRQMLSFYRESPSPVLFKVSRIADGILELYEPKLAKTGIAVEKDYVVEGVVEGFPSELRQVFANLIGNAIEAVRPRGKIRLRIAPARDWSHPSRRGVRASIADTGSGISIENQKRIFEPFFTTKGETGTGLGLWVSRSIVQKHEGRIRFRSSADPGNKGTVFSIFLPAAQEPHEQRSPAETETGDGLSG